MLCQQISTARYGLFVVIRFVRNLALFLLHVIPVWCVETPRMDQCGSDIQPSPLPNVRKPRRAPIAGHPQIGHDTRPIIWKYRVWRKGKNERERED